MSGPAASSRRPTDVHRTTLSLVAASKYGVAVTLASIPSPKPNHLKRWHAIVGTIAGGILAQGGSLVFVVAGLGVLMVYHGQTNAKDLQQIPGAPLVLTVSALAASVFLLAASFATPAIAKVRIRPALGLVSAPFWTFPAAALGALGLGPIGSLVHEGVKKIAPGWTLGTIDFLNDFAAGNAALIVWPLLAVMPAFCEEIFFRGMLQRALGTTRWAIIVSGVSFALFHLDPHHVAAVLPVGLYMAWLAARTGSTFVPIMAHLTNNSIAVIALQFQDASAAEKASDSVPLWILPPAIIAVLASVAIVRHAMRRRDAAASASASPLRSS